MSKKGDPKRINIKHFDLLKLPLSHTFLVYGSPGSGKTNFLEYYAYVLRHRYPVGKALIGSETSYARFCQIMGNLYVSNGWSLTQIQSYIGRQTTKVKQNPEKGVWTPGSPSMLIIDDASEDANTFRCPEYVNLHKKGTQHWASATITASQMAHDMHYAVRSSASYVAIGNYKSDVEIMKLYKAFGGIFGTFDDFKSLLSQVSGQYQFMIIELGSPSNNIEDIVSYIKPPEMKSYLQKKGRTDWKFGCKQYQDWNKARFNTEYNEIMNG